MKVARILKLTMAALLLAACNGMGPIYPTSDTLDDWVTAAASLDPASDHAPVFSDQVAVFQLAPGERMSALHAGRRWGLQQNYLFGFDIRLDPAQAPLRPVTLTRLSRLGPDGGAAGAQPLVSVELDARRGVSVLGRSCVPPEALGDWHSVELRIAFANDDSGFLEIFCDRRPIWAQSHLRTALPPICRLSEGCQQNIPAPARFAWQVGLMAQGRVARKISVGMRRIFFHRLFVIPNRVSGPL